MRPTVSANFARRLYRRHHGADICPSYLSWRTVNAADGRPLAVLGYRAAADGPLFLESYLAGPIETVAAERLGMDVGRGDIVEIGCLAALPSPALVRLWHGSATALGDRFSVAVATLTAPLRRGFARVGLPIVPIAPATRGQLAGKRENWGRYYDQDPVVCVGIIADGALALSRYAARLDAHA